MMKALFAFDFKFLSAKFTAFFSPFLMSIFIAFSLSACSYESEESADESNQSAVLPQTLPNSNSSATLPNGVAPLPNSSQNSPNLALSNSQNKVPQKLADFPKDEIIKVMSPTNELRCYMPDVRNSYVVIGTCRTSWAKPARYDVFGRVAYNINDTWFCFTAPESVAQDKYKTRDYLTLKPCVINDKKQQWKVKDDLFYSSDESYFIKDDGSYLYAVSVLDKGLYTSKLDKSMKSWLDTIAMPVNLSIITSLAWDYATKDGSERYFLYNNGSAKNTTELYYNLESGHIAQFDGLKNINCLYADLTNDKWNWAWWGPCTDAAAPSRAANKAYWSFVRVSETQTLLVNHQGGALRVTSTGLNWGKPYVVTRAYMPQDSTNSPTSLFIIDKDTQDWLRFIAANEGDNLPMCPAIGGDLGRKSGQNSARNINLAQNSAKNSSARANSNANLNLNSAQKGLNSAQNANLSPNLAPNLRQMPPLPRDFELNDEWRTRLLAILNTNDGGDFTAGVCGVCLLQAFQMIAELLENPLVPRASGGYFFDTQAGANPFTSFAARNSLLYQTLDDIVEWFPSYSQGEFATPQEIFEFNNNLALMSAVALLPQYDWYVSTHSQGQAGVARVIDALFNAPQGSAFILSLRLHRVGQEGGHAMAALRLRSGVVLLPTNAPMNAQEFSAFTAPMTSRGEFLQRFSDFGFTIDNIALISAEALYANIFATTISLSDCSGDGEDRRGNGRLPASSLVNQCVSGRCFE